MPEPTAPPVKTNDFQANLLKSIGRVITPDGKKVESAVVAPVEPPAAPVEPPSSEGKPMGLLVLEAKQKADAAAALVATPPVVPPIVPPVTPPVPVVPPVAPPATPAPQPTTRLRKKDAPLPAPIPAPAPVIVPPPAPAPVPSADDEYVKTLSPEQQDELQMAQFAETKFPDMKGKRQELITYFKKVDQYATAHPDTQPGSEEFDQFIQSNKPKVSAGQKRKIETAYITEQAKAEAKKELMAEWEPKLEAANKRIRNQEVTPLIQKAVGEFETLITSPSSLPDPAMESLPADVAKIYKEKGYAATVDQFPVEGPLMASALNAGEEWLNLTHGMTQFNPQNPTHAWLDGFVANQAAIWRNDLASTRNGKTFLPIKEYYDMLRSNPNESSKFYTFTDANVLDMIAADANISYNQQLKSLEKAGFKREKKTAAAIPGQPPAPPPAPVVPPPAPPAPSPRLRSGTAPNPGDNGPAKGPHHDFINRIAPGSADRIGV